MKDQGVEFMKYRNQMRKMIKYDYIILVLSIISLIGYAILFITSSSLVKLLFLSFIVYVSKNIVESLNNILEYNKARSIKKNKRTRVNLKLFNSRRRKIKKAF